MESRLSLGGLGAGLTDRGLCRVAIVRREVEGRYIVTEAERRVADLLPIEVDPDVARATVEEVPFWFHTFALNRTAGIYTPGAARDHRYRASTLPSDFGGMSVLDVGTFDGFMPSSPSIAGPTGWWRSTTSSTGSGSRFGGTSSFWAARASAPFIACSARASSIGRWTRSSLTGPTSASTWSTASGSSIGSRTRSG